MSFFASNDRIFLLNQDGKVIFDTNKPMPHIIQTLTASVSVDFPAVPAKYWRQDSVFPNSPTCARRENVCKYRTVCGFEQECRWDFSVSPARQICENVYACRQKYTCEYEWINYDEWWSYQGFDYTAREWETTLPIGGIVNSLNADFLLINAVAHRTKQGSLADIGPLPCGLPLDRSFIANNTSIVETSSDLRDGTPWLTRIMSVFVEDGIVKVQFKHSNRIFRSVSTWKGMTCEVKYGGTYIGNIPRTAPAGESSYTFDLTIRVGKFTH